MVVIYLEIAAMLRAECHKSPKMSKMQTNVQTETRESGSQQRDCYVATLECSDGNASVGNMWLEHHVCTAQTTIEELMAWKAKQRGGHGKLTIAKAT